MIENRELEELLEELSSPDMGMLAQYGNLLVGYRDFFGLYKEWSGGKSNIKGVILYIQPTNKSFGNQTSTILRLYSKREDVLVIVLSYENLNVRSLLDKYNIKPEDLPLVIIGEVDEVITLDGRIRFKIKESKYLPRQSLEELVKYNLKDSSEYLNRYSI